MNTHYSCIYASTSTIGHTNATTQPTPLYICIIKSVCGLLKVLVVCLLKFCSTDSACTKALGHYFITFLLLESLNESGYCLQKHYSTLKKLFVFGTEKVGLLFRQFL